MNTTITVNFNDKTDRDTTQNVLNNLKAKTGEHQAVILNKALRLYKFYLECEK